MPPSLPYDVERYFRDLKPMAAGVKPSDMFGRSLTAACCLARKWSGNQLPNPIADTELPTWGFDESPEPVRAPSVEEVRRLLISARALDMRYAACLRLVAATGVRRGEACALRWSNIDWDEATLAIDESVIPSNGGAVVKSPKTRASIRRVAVDDGTLAELRRLRTLQQQLAADAGVLMLDRSFVFSAEPGGKLPPYPDTLSRAFTKARIAAGLPRGVAPSFTSTLPSDIARFRRSRETEAGPSRMVNRPHGASLHRLGVQ